MSTFLYNRIVVVGTTSSGKTTLAKYLADHFGHHFIELDGLHWEPNWQEAPLDVFRARVEKAAQAEKWAAAGNYKDVRDLLWPVADAIIWLDYSLPFIFGRLWERSWRRWWSQEELWNGNRENIWMHLKLWSDESLFHWLFKTYWRRKREFAALLSLPENAHLKVLHFKNQKETDAWLEKLFNV
jgi:adenylate kinase family enzyme